MTDCNILEKLKENLSQLPDSELNAIVAVVQIEQNARKNKKRQELINKAVAALRDLQNECFDGGITVYCEDCDNKIYVSLDEIAERIKYVE